MNIEDFFKNIIAHQCDDTSKWPQVVSLKAEDKTKWRNLGKVLSSARSKIAELEQQAAVIGAKANLTRTQTWNAFYEKYGLAADRHYVIRGGKVFMKPEAKDEA